MGNQPVRMKAVVYALPPFKQKVMSRLWNDLPGKIHRNIYENWTSAALLLTPHVGSYTDTGVSRGRHQASKKKEREEEEEEERRRGESK